MTESDARNIKHLKDFFRLQKFWLRKSFDVILVSIVLGAICGLVMVVFNYLLSLFELSFSFLPFYIPPIIAGIATSLLVKFGKLNRIMGTGASEFVEDINLLEVENFPIAEDKYGRFKNLIAKTLSTSWTFGSGMICGLEGPGLLIGGNLGYLLYKSDRFQLERKDSFFIGASACTGAILKAPISGALFCAELPYNNHIKYQSLIPSIIASTVAYLIFSLFFGYTPFLELHQSLNPNDINYLYLLPITAIFGIIVGLIVLIFMGLLRGYKNTLSRYLNKKRIFWLLPFLGAVGYSIFLVIVLPFIDSDFHNIILHADSDFLTILVERFQTADVSWYLILFFTLIFVIAIFLSIGTFNSAGIILPLILLGTLLGGAFGFLVYPSNYELFIILGISAVLGAATNNPITAIFIIIEMTWVPFLFIPAGITTIFAYIFSGPSSIIPEQRYM
ncbi:MAG: hypothetical protein GF317_24255 [Candidatus Lokiarchaeota archaeon]|nr:hypothetical protein [Candidatus Lokiarchaeota archaeon]MBD3202487.1 hypothetical protein [Candidatus Lokiarchaeota archaeon]